MIFAIDKQPVAVYVTFAASLEFAVKRMVSAGKGELGVDAQKRNELLDLRRIEASLDGAFDIALKLVRPLT